MGLLPDGKTYRMYWKDGEQFTNISYNARFYDFQPGQSIVLEHHLLQKPDVYVPYNILIRTSNSNNTITVGMLSITFFLLVVVFCFVLFFLLRFSFSVPLLHMDQLLRVTEQRDRTDQ